jgi:hypothetical protein
MFIKKTINHRTPELEGKHKKSEKRHLEYFRHFENKNQTSEN